MSLPKITKKDLIKAAESSNNYTPNKQKDYDMQEIHD